jgi:hypothetical protein
VEDRSRRAVVDRRDRWKLTGFRAFDVGLEAGTLQVQRLSAHIERQIDPVVWQAADHVAQQFCRNGHGALVLDFGADPAGDPDFEIGRRQFQAPIVAGKQDVAEHRQGAFPGDGVTDDCQTAFQIFLKARKLHERLLEMLVRKP